MYRGKNHQQSEFPDFFLPFGGHLDPKNRWIALARLVPWGLAEKIYHDELCEDFGAPIVPARMALGALLIKERLGLTDRETVETIRENPYLQFFVGCEEFSLKRPFDASLMVDFRKRFGEAGIRQMAEAIALASLQPAENVAAESSDDDEPPIETTPQETLPQETAGGGDNRGQLIADASCAPADIRYPTDVSLLNEAREKTDSLIDVLHEPLVGTMRRPRTYRVNARRALVAFTTEFGAKLSLSVVDRFSFVDRLSWNNYNESLDLVGQIKTFHRRFGFYPASVHVDQIYRTRTNRAFCKARGIRMSGPPLGRPPKHVSADEKKQARADEGIRNTVEGKFGQAKRRFGLGRIMAKLASTSAAQISLSFLVMNLEQALRQLFFAIVVEWPGLAGPIQMAIGRSARPLTRDRSPWRRQLLRLRSTFAPHNFTRRPVVD